MLAFTHIIAELMVYCMDCMSSVPAHTGPVSPTYCLCIHVCTAYHGYNYSYLILANFMGSSYVYGRYIFKNTTN